MNLKRILVSIIFAFLSIYNLQAGIKDYLFESNLKKNGIATKALIVKNERSSILAPPILCGGKKGKRLVQADYSVDGKNYSSLYSGCNLSFSISEGNWVDILYDPSSPSKFIPIGGSSYFGYIFSVLFTFLIFLSICFPNIYKRLSRNINE